GVVQPTHDRRVRNWNTLSKWFGTIRRRNACRVQKILHPIRDAVQWSAVFARRDLGIGALRLRERDLPRQSDDRAQPGIELLAAAIWRSGSPMLMRASFSASSNVDTDTGGPDTGPVPNVGGAPAVGGDPGDEPVCRSPRHATAAAIAPIGAVSRNFRRVFMDA